ncbi:MAG: sulfate reduction electron transfer complex DsrMKJOP subunit DsrJ [Candidatus Latescibacterota bacterium]|nr:MAG: sulfate reduction electron transfer complex DsrMKJOP subunit DsrJ [Candidatus Latescibacterota bacterium]
MTDAGKIIAGIVLFLVIVTSPMWYQLVSGSTPGAPKLEMPVDVTDCVEGADYMRAFHMDLLNVWRDDVVREGDRIHVAPDGKEYDKSLSRTCMSCHSNKDAFCDRCHDYAGVKPYCWDCHVEPREQP